jgi:two-component system, OmpR family, sensor histidine kinase KdpD
VTVERPNPDTLLQRVEEEERRSRRGKLTVFFGAAPGVGKTYAMLEAARDKRREGGDVVAGIVETHGRAETGALLEGLDVLPRREIAYRGVNLAEFDLDGALARRPGLLLVDELAHTNAPGSRHLKRWQDVEELLEAGIDVFTTLNVQHVESLKDVVGQITGIPIRETVPDSVLESAHEIHLVDLTPDELLERLREGKVYVPAQAQRAIENFFRKGNLIALREIALRRTAERVDAQMRQYRTAQGIETTWAASERILVCLSWSPHSARVIRDACRMARGLHAPWVAVYVDPPPSVRLSDEDRAYLTENLRLATQLGAEVVTLADERPAEAVVRVARERNVTKIVVGKPRQRSWRQRLLGNFVDELVKHSGDIDIYVTAGAPADNAQVPNRRQHKPAARRGYAGAALVVALTSAVSWAVFGHTNPSDVVMLYLLGVVVASLRLGYGPSLFAAVLSVMAFDILFVPPYFSFAVTDLRHAVTFAVMLLVAVVISELMRRVRDQAEAARERERHTAALFDLSRELAGAVENEALVAAAARHVAHLFDSDVVVLTPDASGELVVLQRSVDMGEPSAKELGVARWVWTNGREAGVSTNTLPGADGFYLPLVTSRGRLGVLGLVPHQRDLLDDPGERRRLDAFAAQMAVALERVRSAEETQTAKLESERERLRSTLLSSVSHDLRTPLTAIEGAATTLLEREAFLDKRTQHELLETIREEAERLNRRVRNLLDMTRLEAGAVTVNKEWQPLEEVVGAALNHVEHDAPELQVQTRLPESLPLVALDTVLIEQVLVNLLENALRYAPRSGPIELSASATERELMVEVADRGPGIPAGEEERVFERFQRGAGERSSAGVGLGLAICRAIVSAHGGRIWTEARAGGGAVFRFTLPLDGHPPDSGTEAGEQSAPAR